ncbi:MAG: hypothetical protein ACYCOU_25090 [Sulfobacillus sp.]|jgi:hypothetical protein
MNGGFFPTLPYVIPHSPGIAHWFDIFWWVFQLVVMTTLVLLLRHWAVSFDRERDSDVKQTSVTAPPQNPGIPG